MSLSRCSMRAEPVASGSGPWFFRVGVLALVGACFGLGQLHLKFAVSDMERQTNRLQDKEMGLRNQINKARGEVESLKSGERLMAYAESELGMVRMPQAHMEKVQIAVSVRDRYLGAEIAAEAAPEKAPARGIDQWASRIGVVVAANAVER